MSKAQDKFLPMVLSLTLIALISGGLLAVVYDLTKEPIEISKETSRQKNLKMVLPEFDTIKDTVFSFKSYDTNLEIPASIAYKDGEVSGYAFYTEENGYGGAVKVLTGFSPDGTIVNYAIMEHQETPGLGAKADKWFKTSIAGGNAYTTYTVTKDGGNVDGITAATITSRAFLKAVNRASYTYRSITVIEKEATDE